MTRIQFKIIYPILFSLLFASILLYSCKEDDVQPNVVQPKEEEKAVEDFIDYYSLLSYPIVSSQPTGSQFLLPELVFAYPIDSAFEVETDTSTLTYKFEMLDFSLSFFDQIQEFDRDVWSNTKDTLTLLPSSPLQREGTYLGEIKLQLYVQDDNEQWIAVNHTKTSKRYEQYFNYSISPVVHFQLVKGMHFLEDRALNPYRPNILFDLYFIPVDTFYWDEQLDIEVRHEYSIKIMQDGREVAFDYEIHEKDMQLEVTLDEALCESCTYSLDIELAYFTRVFGEEKQLEDPTGPIVDENSYTFVGGENQLSDQIIADNIDYQYPVDRQYTFLTKEYPYGYLKLLYHQEGLLNSDSDPSWATQVRISSLDDTYSKTVPLTYENLTFQYEMPDDLAKETIHKIEFLESSQDGQESVFHTLHIRTSLYDTFLEKIEDNGPSDGYWQYPGEKYDEYELRRFGNNLIIKEEAFDWVEVKGNEKNHVNPFLILTNDFDDSSYYQKIYDLVYKVVELGLLTIEENTEDGVPPLDAVYWWGYPYSFILNDEHIQNNFAPREDSEGTVSNLTYSYFVKHFVELRDKAKIHPNQDNSLIKNLQNTQFYSPKSTWPYYVYYTLPGDIHTSTYHHNP
ncbi:hypothetical protein SAMN04488028_10637 [Reichenbachiella agariperforans]|uniref:Uncharacterized protein n=1 Tax=Reichenbachiella agariperforans TaxID=156994 RepID=A0A1M6TH71_REIAG|nr:hypothetical protein [Reichenbachiella agariperforans]SHK56186.1 hypothetical protein SAMN04488028_10637 [Reichenbachiella agariperforans]